MADRVTKNGSDIIITKFDLSCKVHNGAACCYSGICATQAPRRDSIWGARIKTQPFVSGIDIRFMPVTIKTAPHGANSTIRTQPIDIQQFFAQDPLSKRAQKLVSSSLTTTDTVHPRPNGLVHTVLDAYNQHYHLTLRPDDIWIAILSQLSAYINANSETLRHKFVTHDDKKELVLEIPLSAIEDIDFDSLGDKMTDLLNASLVDKSLKEWIIPNFSTTTRVDKTVSTITLMASMKAYFSYTAVMRCGVPSVTLEGTRNDWIEIQRRLDKLAEFGEQTTIWAAMLKPILAKWISAFEGEQDSDFWGHIASERHLGSGVPQIGGWITAFCVFDDKGKFTGPAKSSMSGGGSQTYILDGISYPIIGKNRIPCGRCQVDLKIINGPFKTVYETVMVAGNMGMRAEKDDGMGGLRVKNMPIWHIGLIKARRLEAAEVAVLNGP